MLNPTIITQFCICNNRHVDYSYSWRSHSLWWAYGCFHWSSLWATDSVTCRSWSTWMWRMITQFKASKSPRLQWYWSCDCCIQQAWEAAPDLLGHWASNKLQACLMGLVRYCQRYASVGLIGSGVQCAETVLLILPPVHAQLKSRPPKNDIFFGILSQVWELLF